MHFRSPSRISSLEGEERRRTWKQSFTPGFGSFNKDLTSETGWESLTCSIRSESSGPASIKSCLKVATQEESLLQRHIPAPKETLLEPKTVSFGCVTVNAHERMLGDNPAVSGGAPLTISWQQFSSVTTSLDDYEQNKPASKYGDLAVPRQVRERWLADVGYRRSEIVVAGRQAREIRIRREDSARTFNSKPLHMTLFGVFARRRAAVKSALRAKDDSWL